MSKLYTSLKAVAAAVLMAVPCTVMAQEAAATPDSAAVATPEAVAAPTVDPISGTYDAVPTTITLTFEGSVEAIEDAYYRANSSTYAVQLSAEAVKIEANVVTITLPAEVASESFCRLTLKAKMADGSYATLGDTEGYIVLEYEAAMSADAYAFESSTPAAGSTVDQLSSIIVVFTSDQYSDSVGFINDMQEISVTDEEGNTYAATIGDSEKLFTNEAVITFATPIVEAGTYKVTIPAATVYNSMADPEADDFGVSFGAIYNPEVTLTFTVSGALSGISTVSASASSKEVYTLGGVKLNGAPEKGQVVIAGGKKIVVK